MAPVRKLPEANDKTARDFKKIDGKNRFFRFSSNDPRRFLIMSKWFLSALRPSEQPPKLLDTWGFFFRGGFSGFFSIWSISSYVDVQIGLELVRLIVLIGLNKFWTNVASPKSLKKISRTTFR